MNVSRYGYFNAWLLLTVIEIKNVSGTRKRTQNDTAKLLETHLTTQHTIIEAIFLINKVGEFFHQR